MVVSHTATLAFRSRGLLGGKVRVSPEALRALSSAQERLPPSVSLVVTRGLEQTSAGFRTFHRIRRAIGAFLFGLLFPGRKRELGEIFGANGHDISGDHIDVTIEVDGRAVNFLPFGVFTPLRVQRYRKHKYEAILGLVYEELERAGFLLHVNETEALQIHCDLHPIKPDQRESRNISYDRG